MSGNRLISALAVLDYARVSQRGSHVKLRTELNGKHSVIVVDCKEIPPGTLHDTLKNISAHHSLSIEELLSLLKL